MASARMSLAHWWHARVEYRLQHLGGWQKPWWAAPVRWLGEQLYRLRRRIEGARNVDTASMSETCGSYGADGVEVEFSGACPVQGEGTVDGFGCYYRSRGEGWQFHVYKAGGEPFDDDVFVYSECRYFFPDGGWVSADVSRACIARGVEKFREAKR